MSKSKLAIAIEALREIAEPIGAIQQRAKQSGMQVNGPVGIHFAIHFASDPNYLKGIARDALRDLGE